MKGAITEGVESCRDLNMRHQYNDSHVHVLQMQLPKNNTSIFRPPPGMLPHFTRQLEVCGPSKSSIRTRCVRGRPGIDNKTGACFQGIRHGRGITRVESIQKSLQRHLGRLIVPWARTNVGEAGHGRRPRLIVGHCEMDGRRTAHRPRALQYGTVGRCL